MAQPKMELDDRVQALPQELYDEILDLTLAPELSTAGTITIDPSYKPPIGLQLNQAARNRVAKSYYSTTIFSFDNGHYTLRWAKSLPSHHLHMVARIHEKYVVDGHRFETQMACLESMCRVMISSPSDVLSKLLDKTTVKVVLPISGGGQREAFMLLSETGDEQKFEEYLLQPLRRYASDN